MQALGKPQLKFDSEAKAPSRNGRFIVLEGLDGSGKSVQFQMLCDYLHSHDISMATADFPNYNSFYGQMIKRYLNQEFGDVYDVNPYFSSMLYAGDRLEARPHLETMLAEGRFLLANRYVGANLAYHSVKLPPQQRPDFVEWVKELEYRIHGIPVENLTIFLHAPVATAQKMVDRKGARDYTSAQRDIHERNAEYLEEVRKEFLWLSDAIPNWTRLDVFDPATSELLTPEVTHQRIVELLQSRDFLA